MYLALVARGVHQQRSARCFGEEGRAKGVNFVFPQQGNRRCERLFGLEREQRCQSKTAPMTRASKAPSAITPEVFNHNANTSLIRFHWT